jgi:hypothetical protein
MDAVRGHRLLAVLWALAVFAEPAIGTYRVDGGDGWALTSHKVMAYLVAFGLGLAAAGAAELTSRIDDTQRWLARGAFAVMFAEIGTGYLVEPNEAEGLALHITLGTVLAAAVALTAARAFVAAPAPRAT